MEVEMASNDKDKDHGGGADFVQAAVHTTSGSYPDQGHEQVNGNQKIEVVLKKAAKALDLTDTNGWVVRLGDQTLNPDESFTSQGLTGVVELDWGPEEGGGGA
jgi:hypothetical protein